MHFGTVGACSVRKSRTGTRRTPTRSIEFGGSECRVTHSSDSCRTRTTQCHELWTGNWSFPSRAGSRCALNRTQLPTGHQSGRPEQEKRPLRDSGACPEWWSAQQGARATLCGQSCRGHKHPCTPRGGELLSGGAIMHAHSLLAPVRIASPSWGLCRQGGLGERRQKPGGMVEWVRVRARTLCSCLLEAKGLFGLPRTPRFDVRHPNQHASILHRVPKE